MRAMWEDEDTLTAKITTADDTYILEPSWRHMPQSDNHTMVVYRKSDVKMTEDLGSVIDVQSCAIFLSTTIKFTIKRICSHDIRIMHVFFLYVYALSSDSWTYTCT